jgi:hypothetical protein
MGEGGYGKRSHHVILPGAAGEDPAHRACASVCVCKIRAMKISVFWNCDSLGSCRHWEAGACARDTFCRHTCPQRVVAARPSLSFPNLVSESLERVIQAPLSSLASQSCAVSIRSFSRSTSHSFQTSSRRIFIRSPPSPLPRPSPTPISLAKMSVIWDSSQS